MADGNMMSGYVSSACANHLLYAGTVLECSSEQSKAPALKCKWEMRDDWEGRWMSNEWVMREVDRVEGWERRV